MIGCASSIRSIRLLTAPDTPAALRAVTRGEAFAFVGNLATTSYYIGASGLTQVKVLGETPVRLSPGDGDAAR